MKLLILLSLSIVCLTSTAQISKSASSLTFYPRTNIDTEYRHTDSTGMSVIIQNSLPKGGGYNDADGKNFEFRIFWTRVINQSTTPLELTMTFPANLSHIFSAPFLKLFLPPGAMSLDKEPLYGYGISEEEIRSFVTTNFNNSTTLQKTISPKEAYTFYVGAVFDNTYGAARTKLTINGSNVLYSIRGISPEFDSTLIPFGQIILKK